MRLDKNGIPVLDPPGENKLKKRRACLPDEHFWDDGHFTDKGTVYTCERCGEKDFVSDPIDEQLLPWL